MTIISRNTARIDPTEIKEHIDLRDIVAKVWGPGKRAGSAVLYHARWRSGDDTASFAVYANGYQDFGAGGDHGDVFDWLRKEYGWSFREALQYLAGRTGNNPSFSAQPKVCHKTPIHEPPPTAWQKIMAEEARRDAKFLWSDDPRACRVLEYLRHKRGLTDETIRRWGLGYNPRWRKTTYRDPEKGKRVWIPSGITIPWWIGGALWAIRVRCRIGELAQWLQIPPDKDTAGKVIAKYLHVGGSKPAGALFNGDGLVAGRDVLFTEGEFDAMLAQQIMGDRLTVVTLGSATNRLSLRWLEQLQSAGRVLTLLDTDQAGEEATKQFPEALHSRRLNLPIGKDVTEFVVEHGGDLTVLICQSRAWWPEGVPDATRSALLAYFPGTAALVIELVNEAMHRGLLTMDALNLDEIEQAIAQQGHRIASSTLRRVFGCLVGVFFSKLETPPCVERPPSSFEKKSGKGRKSGVYRALPLTEIKPHILAWALPRIYEKHHPTERSAVLARPIADIMKALGIDEAAAPATAVELDRAQADAYCAQGNKEERAQMRARAEYLRLQRDLEDVHSTPLPEGWPLNSAPLYRAAFLRAMVEADPDRSWSRRDIRALLGIANGSIGDVVKRAGLKPDPQNETLPIKSPNHVVQRVREFAYEVKGHPLVIESFRPDGQLKRLLYEKDTATQIIADELAHKAAICIQFRVANKYLVVRSTPPPIREFQHNQGRNSRRIGTMYPHRKKTQSAGKGFYGPFFNPKWVYAQLKLAIELGKSTKYEWRGDDLVDRTTGEIQEATALHLLEILLGRRLNP